LIVTTFPRAVRVIEHTTIPLEDGTTLAARIWLPEDAERNPVPAILEYLPYRKRDGTYERDALTYPWLAGHGYAGVRVDIRGSGESDGLLSDEYAQQEQDDAIEIIAWLANQPWCSGAVGMMGISWGGFNGLQVAARRPPALKAIVTICSTDDRYADDVHYMGGAKLNAGFGSLAGDVAGASGERAAVPGNLDPAPAPRRLLAAWLGVRGLRRDPVSGVRGRRLDRRLHQRHSAPPRTARGPAQGPDRAVGACLSAFRAARPADRLPAGHAALVGALAER
jgi:predicted acyl esterase